MSRFSWTVVKNVRGQLSRSPADPWTPHSTRQDACRPSGASNAARRPPADKDDDRRSQLAESALRTLGELGYARTSLREIANNSEFSHGVVHYYFHDKTDLITYCVREYKAGCVRRYDGVVADSTSADELLDAFAAKLAETIARRGADAPPLVRPAQPEHVRRVLRDAVPMIDGTLEDMIWRVVSRYAELAGGGRADPGPTYGVLDGLFQQALLAT